MEAVGVRNVAMDTPMQTSRPSVIKSVGVMLALNMFFVYSSVPFESTHFCSVIFLPSLWFNFDISAEFRLP